MMIENIEQAKERFKRLVDFYKLNDPNNYDYDDRDLISMKLVLEEIERLNKRIKELEEGFTTMDMLKEEIKEQKEEIERLNNIIKEAKRYIEDKYAVILADDLFLDHDERIERKRLLELLEILDRKW